jgi:hypothetical protein
MQVIDELGTFRMKNWRCDVAYFISFGLQGEGDVQRETALDRE